MKKIFKIKALVTIAILISTSIVVGTLTYGWALHNEVEGLAADGYYVKERPLEQPSLKKIKGCIYPRQEQSMWPFL
ncbi:MAG: hypothetical protein UR66_C0004G0004 [Candidatus Moranbacteria bacterium GW2011_GWE1_35_17]|nr:MAG: hypothetical protein UR66_C0004G0004 [Candidatus Moranbacteria bacterium GW2011_GWE1_35_17]KKP81456.1 MAG: hypothetical protein UR83_C0076G0007 [Candidatus Moranbacteria bacterium GW2011_GWF2_35_54]KKP84549.1 MAG: hypothetical protein UR82_C0003G0010 [Candidatus Moranbacteria bacterium GW2011_GWF1_35_5]